MGMWLPNMHRLGPNISTSDITVSAATQANTRDLAKWHVDHAAHSQPVLVRLTVFHHWRGVAAEIKGNVQPLLDDFSRFFASTHFENGNKRGRAKTEIRA